MKSGGDGWVKAAGIGFGPGEEIGNGARRLRNARRVVEEDELRHAPGGLQPIGGHGEVENRRRFALDVDVSEIRQILNERTEEQILFLHRGKILAIDPDEIDRTALVAAGCLLGEHPRHRLGGVGEFDMFERDAKPPPEPDPRPRRYSC